MSFENCTWMERSSRNFQPSSSKRKIHSKQHLLLRTDRLQKTVVGCPWSINRCSHSGKKKTVLRRETGLTSPQLNFGCGDLKCVTRFKQISFLFSSPVKKKMRLCSQGDDGISLLYNSTCLKFFFTSTHAAIASHPEDCELLLTRFAVTITTGGA